MNTNEVLTFYRIHKNSNRTYILLVNLLNPINTHLCILNLNTLIYLHELGNHVKSNLVIHFLTILSWMSLPEANLVNHIPTILSWIPLAKAKLVIHLLVILSQMSLVEANFIKSSPNNPITDAIS